MGTGDEARKAELELTIEADEKAFRKFVITTLNDIKSNGCAQRCIEQRSRIHPVVSSSFIATVLIGIVETLKHFTSTK